MARDFNHVVVIGRLVRDPEIKYTASGVPVTKFSIANNVSYTQNNERKELVNYFDINIWGNQAVNCEKYLKKGSQVAIEGQLRQNRWVDQSSGKNMSKVEILANSVQFLSQNQGGSDQGTGQTYNKPVQQQNMGQNQFQNQNKNQNQNQNQNRDFIPNPWNDEPPPDMDDPFVGPGGSDDDIPF